MNLLTKNIGQLSKLHRRCVRRARNARKKADDMLPGTSWWKAMHTLAVACDSIRHNVVALVEERISNPNSRAAAQAARKITAT